MRCSFCQKRIGFITRLKGSYFKAIVRKLTPHGLLSYGNEIYFCSNKCIYNYEKSTGVRILN